MGHCTCTIHQNSSFAPQTIEDSERTKWHGKSADADLAVAPTWAPGKANSLHHVGKLLVEDPLVLLPRPQLLALVLVPKKIRMKTTLQKLSNKLCCLTTEVFFVDRPIDITLGRPLRDCRMSLCLARSGLG